MTYHRRGFHVLSYGLEVVSVGGVELEGCERLSERSGCASSDGLNQLKRHAEVSEEKHGKDMKREATKPTEKQTFPHQHRPSRVSKRPPICRHHHCTGLNPPPKSVCEATAANSNTTASHGESKAIWKIFSRSLGAKLGPRRMLSQPHTPR